jgi:CYTH domain-containing protein
MNHTNYEIERKYLIQMPDLDRLDKDPDIEKIHIIQTYLLADSEGNNRRIRKWTQKGRTKYVYTSKKKISDLRRLETEFVIDQDHYSKLMQEKDPDTNQIDKLRYRVYESGFCFEIDVFSFWEKQAFMEVELPDEKTQFQIPNFIDVIREVTEEPEYTNHALSYHIPEESCQQNK